MACPLASDDLACNELMQTSCSSFANIDCHVRETLDMSFRINLVSPHLNPSVRAFDVIPAQSDRMNGTALTRQLPTQMFRPRMFRCADQPRTSIRQSFPSVSLEAGRYLGNSGVESGAPHRPPECLAGQPSKYYKVASQPFQEESAPQRADPLRSRRASNLQSINSIARITIYPSWLPGDMPSRCPRKSSETASLPEQCD
jgi:hypothetical protein